MRPVKILPFSARVESDVVLRGTAYLTGATDSQGAELVKAGTPSAAPAGAVIMFHGFTGQRMENGRLFVDLARQLAGMGYAVLTYDRFGHGESDGDFFDMAVGRDVAHVPEVISQFLEFAGLPRTEVDLHFVGFSLGAVVAATAAGALANSATPVASISLWSPASHYADAVRAGFILDKPISALKKQGFIDVGGQRLGPTIVEDALNFDPYQAAKPFKGRALMMHGRNDFVPPNCSQKYARVFGPRAILDLVAGADHSWDSVPFRERLYAATIKNITN